MNLQIVTQYRLPRSNTAQLALYVIISYDKKGGT
jgi:hypothetical protein